MFMWSREGLRDASWDVMESTARLVAYEIASAMGDTVRQHVTGEGGAPDPRLLDTVVSLAQRSATVRFATIVNSRGRVVASNDPDVADHTFPTPADLFDADQRPRLEADVGPDLRRGEFVVQIPFVDHGKPYAYLELTLSSASLAALYRSSYVVLVVVAAVGLAALGGMALLLHLQYERSERLAARQLADRIEGRTVGEGAVLDTVFEPVLAAADRLRATLSDQKGRVEEAREQLAQLGRLLDVGVVLLDTDGRPDFAGERARELFGVTASDAPLEEIGRLLAPVREELLCVQRDRRTVETALQLTGNDPPTVLQLTAAPSAQDESGGLLLRVRDRGQLRSLERDLLQAARLRSLTRLYVGVAHDLKAPINAMVLNLENMRSALERQAADHPWAERQAVTVSVLEEELERLRRMLQMILAQTAPMRSEEDEIDLDHMLEEIELLLAAQARQQRIQLEFKRSGQPVRVRGNPDQIKQAVLNLLINSLEAVARGGRLVVTLERAAAEGRIRISDDGPGIPERVLSRLYEMHVTTKETGTGIGLFVARSGIEAAGGTLELVHTGEDGTTFEIVLPLTGEGAVVQSA